MTNASWQRENSSSLESYKNFSVTSPGGMTSVRTCYCKEEGNASRRKNDDITDENRYPQTAMSKRLIMKNKTYRSNKESPGKEKNDEKMLKNRSVEVQSNPILSPETSTALENAEKIINNTKIQLMEVCAMSNLDSTRPNKNTCSDPPLDDETEELLYIRELVASKFYEATTSRSETNDRASAHLESRSPRLKVDLSAPKFRMSRRRRRADRRYVEYGCDDRSRERASLSVTPSRDLSLSSSSSSKDSNDRNENGATTRDDRARNFPERTSSIAERELVRARENTCEIQIGPSIHIVDRELTRQDLENVHISPESSWCRANTATYVLRHSGTPRSPLTFADNEPREIPGASRKTLSVRLDTSQREKPIVVETAAASVNITTNVAEKSVEDIEDSERDNGRIESLASEIQNCINGEEEKETDATKISECLENANQDAINSVVIENSGTGNERLQDKLKNKNKVKITFCDDMDHTEEGRAFNRNGSIDDQAHLQNEESTVDKILKENPSDRSKPLPDNDTSRKTDFPLHGNIASQTYRGMKSPRLYQTQIDERLTERFSNTFDSHNGQDELYDAVDEDIRHVSFVSNCLDDFQTKDNSNEIELYQPSFNDWDTILLSNDRKIKRIVRATENFTELLSKFEFATYEDKQAPRYVSHEEFHHESSSAEKHCELVLNEPTRSLTFETELKNADLTVSCLPSETPGINANLLSTSTDTTEMRSSSFTKESGSRSKYSKNSVEFSAFPTSDTSYGSEISPDKIQRPRDKAHLSESSIYKSDVTTFSNLIPALSSTRTEIQTYGEKHIIQDNHAERRVTSVNRLSKREIDCSQRECSDKVLAEIPRKDTSEAVDKFIAYILQDEKQSVERKIANALKESTVAPVAVRKLLDNLRNVESIRKARETDTLDILKNILINVQNQTDRETRESVLFTARGESIRQNNNEEDARQTESVDIAKISVNKSRTYESVEDAKTFPGNVANSTVRTMEESILQTQVKNNDMQRKTYDLKKSEKLTSDSSACREKRDDAPLLCSTDLPEYTPSYKNNSEENSSSEAESLKQISDIRSDDDALPRKSSQNPSTRTISAKSNKGCTMEANDTIVVPVENKADGTSNEKLEDESNDARDKDVSQGAVKEITIEEVHDNVASVNQNVLPAKVSDVKDARVHLDANSAVSVGEILEKDDVSLSPTKENVESSRVTEKDVVGSQHSEEKVDLVANSDMVDSLRDHVSLLSAKNDELFSKEVASHIEQSIIAGDNDLVKDLKDNETHVNLITITTVDDRRIEDSVFLKNTKRNNEERSHDLEKYKTDILSNYNSSISSTLLDHDNRSMNDAFSENGKSIETSSETSHSEGELYMPSSCSYSLGEVRVLKKRGLITDNSLDRDSSATILVTRSILTSLNDSPLVSHARKTKRQKDFNNTSNDDFSYSLC